MIPDNNDLVNLNGILFHQLFQSQLECTETFSIFNTDFRPGVP